MPIRLLLADDNAEFLMGLRFLFESCRDIVVVGEAASGVDAVRLAHTCHPDVALLDVRMPGLSGIEAARRIALHSPAPAVILCSIMVDPSYVIEAVKAGAVGYVSKTASPAEILDAVRSAAKGGTCFGPLAGGASA